MPGQLRLGDNCVTMEGITVSDQQEVSADEDNVLSTVFLLRALKYR